MANLYKDADKRRKVIPGGAGKPQEPAKEEEAVTTPAEPEKAQEAVPVAENEPVQEQAESVEEKEAEQQPAVDLLADLIPQKKKPKPETYGFYLDSDVHDELVRLAKANKTNKSKFLNALLRRVLFNE